MTSLSARLRERVRLVGPADATPEEVIASADVLCLASGGPHTAPGLVRQALASGTVPVVSHLPVYEELIADGELGLLPARGRDHPRGPARAPGGGAATTRRAQGPGRDAVEGWSETTDELEGIYARVRARRHDPRGNQAIRQRLASRRAIHCDLHMHTDHSPDCATPVPVLLETARERGLGDCGHGPQRGLRALEARELADGMDGSRSSSPKR